jgi:hypothetical protein
MPVLDTPEKRAAWDIQQGRLYPYHGKPPKDWAEIAALGICHDLCDRRGIKQAMRDVDEDPESREVSNDIVQAMAAIIRCAHSTAEGAQSRD